LLKIAAASPAGNDRIAPAQKNSTHSLTWKFSSYKCKPLIIFNYFYWRRVPDSLVK